MREESRIHTRSLALFLLLLLVFALAGAGVFLLTGDMGIEERFSRAVGMESPGEDGEGDGFGAFGFGIEGNPAAYLVVLLILGGGAALLAYRNRHR
jgi:hypothetical protein